MPTETQMHEQVLRYHSMMDSYMRWLLPKEKEYTNKKGMILDPFLWSKSDLATAKEWETKLGGATMILGFSDETEAKEYAASRKRVEEELGK